MSETPPEKPEESDTLPSVDVLLNSVRHATSADAWKRLQAEWTRSFRTGSIQREEEYEHLKGLRDHYQHKGYWSYFLMFLMLAMIVFQSVLLGMVGAGSWDFSKYQWLLPLLLVQNLAQVIGLAVWVVKALFKDLK